jgi:hypothetical protein
VHRETPYGGDDDGEAGRKNLEQPNAEGEGVPQAKRGRPRPQPPQVPVEGRADRTPAGSAPGHCRESEGPGPPTTLPKRAVQELRRRQSKHAENTACDESNSAKNKKHQQAATQREEVEEEVVARIQMPSKCLMATWCPRVASLTA